IYVSLLISYDLHLLFSFTFSDFFRILTFILSFPTRRSSDHVDLGRHSRGGPGEVRQIGVPDLSRRLIISPGVDTTQAGEDEPAGRHGFSTGLVAVGLALIIFAAAWVVAFRGDHDASLIGRPTWE